MGTDVRSTHKAPKSSMDALIAPGSIAVVGASENRSKLAGRLVSSLRDGGFRGDIFPVNPKYAEVDDLTCYPTLDDIPSHIDHCIVIVPQQNVQPVLESCVKMSVRAASIFSAGYGETDDGGGAQESLVALSEHVTFFGPNCMGFANFVESIVATSTPVFSRQRRRGDVALVSQSGGLAFGGLAYGATEQGMEFSYVLNIGNGVGVSISDLYAYICADDGTRVALFVLESEALLADLVRAVDQSSNPKPTVLLKLGRGETGFEMARSHTGALAGDYEVARQLASQVGIVCASDLDEALGIVSLARAGFDPSASQGLAMVSISGGNLTLAADIVDGSSLSFAEFDDSTVDELRDLLPSFVTVHNPLDLTGENRERHSAAYTAIVADPNVTALVPILTVSEDGRHACSAIADVASKSSRPVAVIWNGGSYDNESRAILRDADIPVFSSASSLVRSFDLLCGAGGRGFVAPVASTGTSAANVPKVGQSLSESEAFAFLSQNKIPVPKFARSKTGDLSTVLASAQEIGFPVVVKADVQDTGLSDRGGVIVDIRDAAELGRALRQVESLGTSELLLMEFLGGSELFASTVYRPPFGLMLTIGTGGRLVELLQDVRFLRLPASRESIERELRNTVVGYGLWSGFRGMSGFDAASDLLERVANVAVSEAAKVAQIELNPVMVGAHGAAAVDAAIIMCE
jgi:acyl-CoA synthetase (NDP forming)